MDLTGTAQEAGAPPAPASVGVPAGPSLIATWVRALWIGLVVAAGTAVLTAHVLTTPPGVAFAAAVPLYATLALALVVGELRPVPVLRSDDSTEQLTTSTTFAAALLVLGPLSLATLLLLLAVLVDDLVQRRHPLRIAYNAAQYALSMWLGRLVFSAATGQPVGAGPVPIEPEAVPAALAAAATFAVSNHVLVAVVVALHSQRSIWRVIGEDARFSLTTSGVLVALAPLAAYLAQASPLLLLLLCTPILAVHRSAAEAMQRREQALRDPLTGLANRELLQKRTARLLESAHESPQGDGPALLLIDLDHFKDVNDTLGHAVGDALLGHLAGRLTDVVGERGTVARLGGDEFAVLLPAGRRVAERMASELLESLQAPAEIDQLRLLVQASIGVAVAPEHGQDVSTLFKHADTALYDAKEHRARFAVYRREADVNSVDRLALLADLRSAVDRGELDVVFQPQLSLRTGQLAGAEALVRWNHPSRGVVMPDDFISLAENAGLIGEVTRYVVDAGLAAVGGWRRCGHDITLAVNISARHMSDLALPELVGAALRRHGVPASALTLEVTETAILSDPARVDVVVDRLRAAGVSIAIDDYGTGHASLNYLKRLRIDELKIDKSFVVDLLGDPGNAIIVGSTVDLGHALGLRIVAEGVEDAATLQRLQTMGCDLAQGYYIGHPVPAAEFLLRLTGGQTPAVRPHLRVVVGQD